MQIYRLDCINQICKKICSENMQKYADLYVKYAEVYLLHILHLYALPTLLMTFWIEKVDSYELATCSKLS